MQLQFLAETEGGLYRNNTVRPVLEDTMLDDMAVAAAGGHPPRNYYCVKAEIGTGNFMRGNKRSIMCLDCDSEGAMLAALHYIKIELKYNCYVVESSPNHYWIITDYAAPFIEVYKLIQTIPGIDEKYVSYMKASKDIVLRSFFKENGAAPKFVDNMQLTDPSIIEWVDALKSFWESKRMKQIHKAYILGKAVKDGTVQALMADPAYAV